MNIYMNLTLFWSIEKQIMQLNDINFLHHYNVYNFTSDFIAVSSNYTKVSCCYGFFAGLI